MTRPPLRWWRNSVNPSCSPPRPSGHDGYLDWYPVEKLISGDPTRLVSKHSSIFLVIFVCMILPESDSKKFYNISTLH